ASAAGRRAGREPERRCPLPSPAARQLGDAGGRRRRSPARPVAARLPGGARRPAATNGQRGGDVDPPVKVKMILPALTEALSPYFRPIKYSLFPPLGLATLAGFLDPGDEVQLQDEHVEKLALDDTPDLVVIQVYITSAGRAYRPAYPHRERGAHVCPGGVPLASLPDEAASPGGPDVLRPGG